MLLKFLDLGVTISWDEGFPGARDHSPLEGESQKLSRQATADTAGGWKRPVAQGSFFSIINIDRQDGQDKRDESLLHKKPARPMIRCGLADARDYKTPDF